MLNSEDELRKMHNDLKLEQTISMIRLMAINFTKDTICREVERGTTAFPVSELDERDLLALRYPDESPRIVRHRTTYIYLIPFFGMYAGYDARLDYFVFWK